MNNYHIYESIGKGMHSVVYKGRKKKTIMYYAIKSVQKSQKQRVHQEVKTIHDLVHPNILRFHSWYETGNHLWLILEYCVGGDLKNLLTQDERLPESSVHDFGRDLLAALQFLHCRGIIHCDLKPSNVMLDEDGTIKLGGFSVARKLSNINAVPLAELQPASRGTPAYMAPELFQEGAAQSTASDLWALGCVLYECLVGRPPFINASFSELVRLILHADAAPMDGASPEFASLVERLLDKNPATRMTWAEMLTHPFWRFTLGPTQMPREPALERYIEAHGLRPRAQSAAADAAAAQMEGRKASARARMVRESVDITRLSHIVRGHMQGGDDAEPASAGGYADAQATSGDVRLANADAELVFQDRANLETAASDASAGTATPPALHRSASAADDASGHAPAGDASGPTVSARPGNVPVAAADAAMAHASGHAPAAALLFHRSDLTVRPLVGNKRIETVPPATWSAHLLPEGFSEAARERLRADPTAPHAAEFVERARAVLASTASPAAKVNLLAFLEPLCADERAADALVNTPLTAALVACAGASGAALRAQACHSLGLLVRYAKYIDMAAMGPAVPALHKSLSDREARVRRRAVATLGELVYYLSSEGTRGHATWPAPAALAALLAPAEDAVTRHYAAKVVENMMTARGAWAEPFARAETVAGLLEVLKGPHVEGLSVTAASALARTLRCRPALLEQAVAGGAAHVARRLVNSSDHRLQIHGLNALNLALAHCEPPPPALAGDASLAARALDLLNDPRRPYVAAKALLALSMLVRRGGGALAAACEAHLVPRALALDAPPDAEARAYVQQCQAVLRGAVLEGVACTLREASAALAQAHPDDAAHAAVAALAAVPAVLSQPALRPAATTPALIEAVAALVATGWGAAGAPPEAYGDANERLQLTLDALLHELALATHGEAFVRHLVPALCTALAAQLDALQTTHAQADLCANIARMLAELAMHYLASADAYRPGAAAGAAGSADVTAALDDVLAAHVVPLLPRLAAERDPMPLYAQKVLALLLSRNEAYVAQLAEVGLVLPFFEFLDIQCAKNNIHNIRVCRALVATGAVATEDLHRMDVAQKVSTVLEYAHEHNIEAFLEPAAELCVTLLQRDRREAAAREPGAGTTWHLVRNVQSFVVFCAAGAAPIARAAASCVVLLSEMYPAEAANTLLSDDGIAALLLTVSGDAAESAEAAALPAETLEALLTMLVNCGTKGRSTAGPDTIVELHSMVLSLKACPHAGVAQLADQVAQMFD